jgi:hypothetical protein
MVCASTQFGIAIATAQAKKSLLPLALRRLQNQARRNPAQVLAVLSRWLDPRGKDASVVDQ